MCPEDQETSLKTFHRRRNGMPSERNTVRGGLGFDPSLYTILLCYSSLATLYTLSVYVYIYLPADCNHLDVDALFLTSPATVASLSQSPSLSLSLWFLESYF